MLHQQAGERKLAPLDTTTIYMATFITSYGTDTLLHRTRAGAEAALRRCLAY